MRFAWAYCPFRVTVESWWCNIAAFKEEDHQGDIKGSKYDNANTQKNYKIFKTFFSAKTVPLDPTKLYTLDLF